MPNSYEDSGKEVNLPEIISRFNRSKQRFAHRDTRMAQVRAIRQGKMSEVAPDLFPDSGPWQEPIVANMIDIAARDVAEMLAPLPTFACSSPNMSSEKSRENASIRTRIAHGYINTSELDVQMYTAADQYVSYGFLPFRIEIDYDRKMPIIRVIDPVGSYPEYDRFGKVSCLFQRILISRDELSAKFPEFRDKIKKTNGVFGSQEVEVVFYHDKDWDLAFMMGQEPLLLEKVRNPIGKPMVVVPKRPGATNDPRGQFDDVIFIQLAKSSMALLALQAAHESVNAPIIIPSDVPEVPYGPGATIRTNNPAGVGRMRLDLPAEAFAEQQQLERELQLGARFPQVRTGNADAAIVTGKGVQALMGGYDSQIRGHQVILAKALENVISLCFEVDEKVFGNVSKTLRGSEHGASFEITYTPSKHIAGNYTVDVAYGLMAGLDPNRWLVFALQARQERMFSRDFMRRELPFAMDVEDEARQIDIEDMEEAAKQAILAYAQSIPMMIQQGQDPYKVIELISQVIDDRRKGKTLVDTLEKTFKPVEAPMAQQEQSPEAMLQGLMGGGGAPGGMPQLPGGAPTPQPTGEAPVEGVPGEAPAEEATPDLASILASL
jgi:hypothetical protein